MKSGRQQATIDISLEQCIRAKIGELADKATHQQIIERHMK